MDALRPTGGLYHKYKDLWEAYLQECSDLRASVYTNQSCQHTQRTYVQAVNAGGQRCFYLQCANCGRCWQVSRGDLALTGIDISALPDRVVFDTNARWREEHERYRRDAGFIEERYEREATERYEKECRDSREEYNAYLQTPQWKRIRDVVLTRDKYMCQGCFINRAIHVHHLTYDHFGDEFMWELIAVCGMCHERIHGVIFEHG